MFGSRWKREFSLLLRTEWTFGRAERTSKGGEVQIEGRGGWEGMWLRWEEVCFELGREFGSR